MTDLVNPNIIIADAIDQDATEIAAILKLTWTTTYPNDAFGISYDDVSNRLNRFTPETIANRIQNQQELNRHYWKASIDNQLIGICCALKDESNQVFSILSLYVASEYQNQGVGTKLLSTALDWLGNQDIELGVAVYNLKAINFYKQFGFIENGPRHDEISNLPSGKVIPEISMLKKASH